MHRVLQRPAPHQRLALWLMVAGYLAFSGLAVIPATPVQAQGTRLDVGLGLATSQIHVSADGSRQVSDVSPPLIMSFVNEFRPYFYSVEVTTRVVERGGDPSPSGRLCVVAGKTVPLIPNLAVSISAGTEAWVAPEFGSDNVRVGLCAGATLALDLGAHMVVRGAYQVSRSVPAGSSPAALPWSSSSVTLELDWAYFYDHPFRIGYRYWQVRTDLGARAFRQEGLFASWGLRL